VIVRRYNASLNPCSPDAANREVSRVCLAGVLINKIACCHDLIFINTRTGNTHRFIKTRAPIFPHSRNTAISFLSFTQRISSRIGVRDLMETIGKFSWILLMKFASFEMRPSNGSFKRAARIPRHRSRLISMVSSGLGHYPKWEAKGSGVLQVPYKWRFDATRLNLYRSAASFRVLSSLLPWYSFGINIGNIQDTHFCLPIQHKYRIGNFGTCEVIEIIVLTEF